MSDQGVDPGAIPEVVRRLSGRSDSWIVGGPVRDLLSGRVPADYDIAVDGDPEAFALQLARNAGKTPVKIGKDDKAIWRVALESLVFDFARIQGKSIEEDLGRRDFTINAMAIPVHASRVIDPLGGQKDLDRRMVRMVSPEGFDEDPLRLVRAYRFAAALGFSMDLETEAVIGEKAHKVSLCAGERVREELFKILESTHSGSIVRGMAKTGLLQRMLPEVGDMEGIAQSGPHRYDVLEHTLRVLGHLESILENPSRMLPLQGRRAVGSLGDSEPALVKAAALFHDVGKPKTQKIDRAGGIHFHGHAAAGARIAEALADRLHFSNRQRRFVAFMVRHHIRPLHLFLSDRRGVLTQKGKTRLFIHCGELTPALLLLSAADMSGKRSTPDNETRSFAKFVDDLLGDYLTRFRRRQELRPLVDGNDLIDGFGIEPSVFLGRILDRIEAERLEGALDTREDALYRAAELIALWKTEKGS